MSFRCPACSDKSYDKAWKLQRHIRESNRCFEQLNPGISRTRFQCSSCDYTSPREEDLRRHRRRVHADIVTTTATDTEAAGQPTLGSYESSNVALCLQPEAQLDTNEHSDEIERLDSHQSSESSTAIAKRKISDLTGLSQDHKRVCFQADLIDLDVLSLVCDKETSTLETTENLDRMSLVSRALTGGPTAPRPTAPKTSTHNAIIQSTSSSSKGTPQSISISCSSLGSLFGKSSKRGPELWMTWSPTSPGPASLKSLHSLGMPAPMLGSLDQELLLSRAGNHLAHYRHYRAAEVFGDEHDSYLEVDSEDECARTDYYCLFGSLGCPYVFTNSVRRMKHHLSHLLQSEWPRQSCPCKTREQGTWKQDGEDAYDQRWKDLEHEHDILSQSAMKGSAFMIEVSSHLEVALSLRDQEIQDRESHPIEGDF